MCVLNRLGALAISFLAAVIPLATAQDVSSFTSHTELVLVPTFVADKKGQTVRALRQQDFAVLEDGTRQKLAIFEEIEASRPASPPQRVNGAVDNDWSSQSGSRRFTIVVLDTTAAWANVAYARHKLLKYLASTPRSLQPTALLVRDRWGLRVIHDFTSTNDVLAAALKAANASGTPDNAASIQERRPASEERMPISHIPGAAKTDPQVAAETESLQSLRNGDFLREWVDCERWQSVSDIYRTIARAVAGIPGQKSLVWIGDSMPPSFRKFPPEFLRYAAPSEQLRWAAEWRDVWRELSEARIPIYPISAEGLVAPTGGSVGSWNSRLGAYANFHDIADETGGRAYVSRNDIDIAIREASADAGHYYLLGYYRTKLDPDPVWHRTSVVVSRAGVKVRSRAGFFSSTANELAARTEETVELAFLSPLQFTGLPIQVRAEREAGTAAQEAIKYEVRLPENSVLPPGSSKTTVDLEIVVEQRDERGRSLGRTVRTLQAELSDASRQRLRAGGLTYATLIPYSAGAATCRVVVANRVTGQVGSVDVTLNPAE